MGEKINNIIPILYAEIESDGENESKALLGYYVECNSQERAVVNNIMMYISILRAEFRLPHRQ